jgi:hypothetical protein
MIYSRDTTAISEITGEPVNTSSEEWRAACEARAVLKMAKAEREAFYNGRKDENGKTIDRGVVAIRGVAGAELVRINMQKLEEARSRRS